MHQIFMWLPRKQSVVTKTFHAIAVLMLVAGLLPGPVQAATPEPDSTGSKTFLPFVTAQTDLVTSSKASPILFGATPRKLRYEVGKLYQYEYGVQIDTSSAKRDAKGIREEGSDTTILHAFANVTIISQEADGVFAGEVVLQEPTYYHTDGTTQRALEDAETLRALAVPLRFKQAANGVITEVAWPTDAPAQVVNIQKGVLNALQVTLQEGQNDYIAEEQGGQGSVRVHYTLQEQSDGLHITKQYTQDSFSKLVRSGDPDKGMKLQNSVELVLDRNIGVISAMIYNENIASGDGAADPDPSNTGFDGVTTWSTVKSTGRLALLAVSESQIAAAGVGPEYTAGSLAAEFPATSQNRSGIDLNQVDLNSELARLENEPDSPEPHARLLALVEADNADPNNNIDILKLIAGRLQTHAANAAIASAYIDLLAAIGTPQAQDLLSAVLGNSQIYPEIARSAFAPAAKNQALIVSALLKSPTSSMVETVKALLTSVDAGVHDTAVTVLGALADQLADEDPAQTQQLADLLTAHLKTAREAATIEVYLNALGNVAAPSTLELIKPYLHATTTSPKTGETSADLGLQATALVALRKISGQEAEALLVDVLNDTQRPNTLRSLANNLLHERSDLSESAQAALARFNIGQMAAPGRYNYSWTKLLGNSNLGVEFPGGIDVASPPATTGLAANAYQAANGRLFGNTLPIAKGELRSFRRGDYQVFGAYLSLAGYVIAQSEQQFPCAVSRTGNLFNGTLQVLDVTYSIPVYAVITLNINVKASGSFSLDWNFSVDFCGITQITLNAGITPKAWVTAEASAYLELVVVRGGATLTATLLKTELPAKVSLVLNNTPSLQFCLDIKANTQPLSGYLDVWADVRVWWNWVRIGSKRLWNFSTPSKSYPLWVQCY